MQDDGEKNGKNDTDIEAKKNETGGEEKAEKKQLPIVEKCHFRLIPIKMVNCDACKRFAVNWLQLCNVPMHTHRCL